MTDASTRRPTPRSRRLPGACLTLALLLLAPSSQADEALMTAVHAFLHEQARSQGEEVVIEVRPPSAHLPACEAPQPFLTHASRPVLGRVSVGVRCGAEGRQVRYLQAEVGVVGDYPVAARDIAPGTTITSELLERRRGDLSRLPSQAVLDPAAVLGQVARRSLPAGAPLQAHQFQARALVERGQKVAVEARGQSFRVTREGEALEAGGEGERVRVRFDNRELVTATVIGEARLAVDL
ncbi:flagellar basal body P-ring formation chaperone FlgA [Halomonas sp. C05BenzN]|uniref:flagellar basal body P-ring formation chaperone FlgA n=1 Tax=Halomonas sp. C05BenzN TaxID=3411041 RepID=UPI003B931ED3